MVWKRFRRFFVSLLNQMTATINALADFVNTFEFDDCVGVSVPQPRRLAWTKKLS